MSEFMKTLVCRNGLKFVRVKLGVFLTKVISQFYVGGFDLEGNRQ
jgi:hypothetical protein